MSFLAELKKQKDKLKVTETVVTRVDGKRYLEGDISVKIKSKGYGFVVDTKPDDVPVLVTEYVYIGSQDCAVSAVLLKYNIKHVLSLGIDVTVSDGINHKYMQMLDLPEVNIRAMLSECVRFIRSGVDAEENVLVHCNAGVSRTAAVAIAYLMHYECLSFEDAYSLVKSKRPAIRPNDGFREQLKTMLPGHLL